MTEVLVVPARSLHQRHLALEAANRVRMRRAEIKRELKAGRLTLVDAFEDVDARGARVIDLLMALPRVGRSKAGLAMTRARVSTVKTVGGMTPRQHEALLRELGRWPSVRRATFGA
jgi:hypothetical protein